MHLISYFLLWSCSRTTSKKPFSCFEMCLWRLTFQSRFFFFIHLSCEASSHIQSSPDAAAAASLCDKWLTASGEITAADRGGECSRGRGTFTHLWPYARDVTAWFEMRGRQRSPCWVSPPVSEQTRCAWKCNSECMKAFVFYFEGPSFCTISNLTNCCGVASLWCSECATK